MRKTNHAQRSSEFAPTAFQMFWYIITVFVALCKGVSASTSGNIMLNSRGEYPIENVVFVGFGGQVLAYSECHGCKARYIQQGCTDLGLLFCDTCVSKGRADVDKIKSHSVRTRNLIDWEQRFDSSSKRTRYNFNKVLKRDNYICQYCGYNPRLYVPIIPLHVDHVNPFSFGGNNSLANLVCACATCNLLISNKWFTSFIDKKCFIVEERKQKGLPVGQRQWNDEQLKFLAKTNHTTSSQI